MTEIKRLYIKRLCELGVAKSEHTICLREALAGAIPDLMAVRNKFGKWSLGLDESIFEAMKNMKRLGRFHLQKVTKQNSSGERKPLWEHR